jgi:hypothetical protein
MRRPGGRRVGLRNPSSLQGNERPVRGRLLTGPLARARAHEKPTPDECESNFLYENQKSCYLDRWQREFAGGHEG